MKNTIAIIAVLILCSGAYAKPMSMIDLLNVPLVSDAQLSPESEHILFVKRTADWVKNKNVSTIWRSDLDGNNLLQITSSISDTTAPRWSPDGSQIAFLSKRGDDEVTQLYVMPANGGEALRISNHVTNISAPQWSMDGKNIYFLAIDAQSEEEKENKENKDDIYKFEQNYHQRHLWKVSIDGGDESRITEGSFSTNQFKFSQDGKKIIHNRRPNPLLDAAMENEIWIMNTDGSKAVQITDNNNPESGAELSPDGKNVIYISWTDENDQPYFENNLFIIPVGGGDAKQLLGDFDHDIEEAHWSSDGKTIFFSANLGIHTELFKLDVATNTTEQITDGKHTVSAWHYNVKNDEHILSIKTAHNNGDFWHLASGELKKITSIYDQLAVDFDLPEQDVVRWTGEDGVTVEGMIIYPNDYEMGKRYPLVVQTHGGPRASDQWGIYSTTSYATVLAANGYVILRPNYRGSVGYGDDFVRDMVGSYFNQSHLDVMTGVDHLIAEGIVDGNQMVKMGYSAGGHMTNKIITHTDRFKAASSAAGTVNWISMYSQSDTRIYRTPWFGGTPWQKNAPIDTYWDHSPLKDISKVTTPTMIIVGGADVRVPKQQSIELYRALKSNGVETDLYIVPREQHGWQELRHKLSKMNVEMTWFEKYVKGLEFLWEKLPE